MGKMKALLIDKEETENNRDEDLSMYEEAHYHHVINDYVSLVQVYGWSKVEDSLIEKLLTIKGDKK